jgi:peptide/nickel transport system ATP-binding protein
MTSTDLGLPTVPERQKHLLEVRGLHVGFRRHGGGGTVVDGVDLDLEMGKTLCLVGESGSGKSVTALALMGLLGRTAQVGGSVRFDGRELVGLPESRMREVRGNDIAMIFQEPMSSLNPLIRIGDQIAESVRLHRHASVAAAKRRAVELLELVGISAPQRRMTDYPHQLSGGMRQRVMIAIALACDPKLLIADEPTTALDVTIQAQILELMRELQSELGMALLLITHDLGVVAETADRVAVMYAGQIVEQASAEQLFGDPRHPYTQALLASIPRMGSSYRTERLTAIRGVVPSPADWPAGCRFAARCDFATLHRIENAPPLIERGDRVVRCWREQEEAS